MKSMESVWNKTLLVTGGAGFIGSIFVELAIKGGAALLCWTLLPMQDIEKI
jgi:nucleoside-diphosphate-sugar epimerase